MKLLHYYFQQFPIRLSRLSRHFVFLFYKDTSNAFPPHGALEWFFDGFFYIIDVFGIPEWHQAILRVLKWNMRPLNDAEIRLAWSVFGNSVQYDLVRIDDDTRLGTRRMALAYVSFNTINYRRHIKDEILIHEFMHIWQFQHFGSIYIARAIQAQRSREGYNYGGVGGLYQVMLRGGSLLKFNFEQQADIIEDYFKKVILHKKAMTPMDVQIYTYFAAQLQQF